MRLRLAIATMLALLALAAYAGLRLTGTVETASRSAGSQDWQREYLYLELDNAERLGHTRDTLGDQPQVPAEEVSGPNRIRVLVVGDSVTEGHGLYDMDQRWPVKLQDLLDQATAPGVFQVRSLARSGASTAEEAQWLSSGALEEYDPEVVVLAFNDNDVVPSGRDAVICPRSGQPCEDLIVETTAEYQQCLRESGLGVAHVAGEAARRLCDPGALSRKLGLPAYDDLVRRPETTVYWYAFVAAVSDLREMSTGRVFLVSNPTGKSGTMAGQGRAIEELTKAFPLIGAPRGEQAADRQRDDMSLAANPADTHPGPALTAAIAADVADAVMAYVTPERVQRALSGAKGVTRPLVSNFLPAAMEVEVRGIVGATARYPSSSSAAVIEEWASLYASRGMAGQHAPCSLIGRPHGQLWIDRAVPPGTRLRVTLSRADKALEVLTAGYVDGRATWQAAGALAPGESVEVTFDPPRSKGILIADPAGTPCEPGVSAELPAFQVDIARVS